MSRAERRLLVVEDDPDDEELTLMALREAGVEKPIDVVRDGQEAVEYLLGTDAVERPLPLFVIIDLHLPGLDGFGVLERIRAAERTRRLPAVVLTASTRCSDVERAKVLRTEAFLTKPIEVAVLTEVVRQLGLEWLLLGRSE